MRVPLLPRFTKLGVWMWWMSAVRARVLVSVQVALLCWWMCSPFGPVWSGFSPVHELFTAALGAWHASP